MAAQKKKLEKHYIPLNWCYRRRYRCVICGRAGGNDWEKHIHTCIAKTFSMFCALIFLVRVISMYNEIYMYICIYVYWKKSWTNNFIHRPFNTHTHTHTTCVYTYMCRIRVVQMYFWDLCGSIACIHKHIGELSNR